MSGANKILTVSYGTFSCTIEGFEDPFGTMKQIAEYFRDLAAEDRYFGAEPPVPDAEALRHLAEREAARRVEARMSATGVHLRQLDDAAAARAATPVTQSAPDTAAAAAASAVAARDVLTPSEVIDPEPESVAARLSRIRAVVARARSTSVWPDEVIDVADLADGSDAAPSDTQVSASGPVPAEQAIAGATQPEPVGTEAASGHETSAPAFGEEVEVVSSLADDQDDPFGSKDLPEPVFLAAVEPEAEIEPEAELKAEADPEAVVHEEAPADPFEVSTPSESFAEEVSATAEPAVHDSVDPMAASDHDVASAESDDDESVGRLVSETDDALLDTSGAELDAEALEATAARDPKASEIQEYDENGADDVVADPRSETLDTPAARLVALRKADHAAAAATDRLEDMLSGRISPQDVFSSADDGSDGPFEGLADDADGDDGGKEDRTASLLAAIRAIGDTDREALQDAAEDVDPANTEVPAEVDAAADSTGEWQPDHAAEDEALDYAALAAPPLRLDNSLRVAAVSPDDSPATEVDAAPDRPGQPGLEGLVADLHDEFEQQDDSAADPLLLSSDPYPEDADGEVAGLGADAADTSDSEAAHLGRAGHDLAVEDLERVPEEASVDRLLAETNSQLESTEMNRRRSAIAHLKAAVAAARADKVAPEAGAKSDEGGIGSAIDKFREDLARVVRPRRPVDDGQPRTMRRMPPLMLVSEQRVDVAEAAPRSHDALAGTVRPRRVTTREVSSDENEEASSGGFAVFAESMGARDLPDMLEAAAAYTAFVEGRPSFSRPQLMQMMRVADGTDDEFSREEQLRSFGLLLRQGRIQKLKRGQFTVADDTRFRPEHRHAGE
jgi:hypothetical protein